MAEIKQIQIGSTIYDLRDEGARTLISNLTNASVSFFLCTNAGNTPAGVVAGDSSNTWTGTLTAKVSFEGDSSQNITPAPGRVYLVKSIPESDNPFDGKDIYDEYIALKTGTGTTVNDYTWERIGNTEIDFSELGALAYKDNVSISNKDAQGVLGENATFTSTSTPNFGSHTTVNAVTGYASPDTAKLVTSSVLGVQASTTTASLVTTVNKTAATKAATATTVGNANVGSAVGVMTGASVSNGVLSFSSSNITPAASSNTTIYGCGDNVSFTAVNTVADVTVPKKDASATTIATGALAANGSGGTVMTGLGTATTQPVIKTLGTLTVSTTTSTNSKDKRTVLGNNATVSAS